MNPKAPPHIHLMGICGTGMASLAGILKEQGYQITGSDEQAYPPMSTFLAKLGIQMQHGYRPENLQARPDSPSWETSSRDNPEAQEMFSAWASSASSFPKPWLDSCRPSQGHGSERDPRQENDDFPPGLAAIRPRFYPHLL